ncbi:MAG: neutral zinc metallopeptidase, partial [Planctomycetaceae bacterium]|nr:neutral zinc metallopeptidase [Planctomycetaceae bacterium]
MVRWEGERRSENVDDRRGQRMPRAALGGGGGILLLILVFFLSGGDLRKVLQVAQQQQANAPAAPAEGEVKTSPEQDRLLDFSSVILASTEDVWTELFRTQLKSEYQPTTLTAFTQQTTTRCGIGDARMGPFYCPADQRVYIDLAFFEELSQKFGAPGDFAQAYVIAHEVGHHVQNQLGISDQVHQAQQRLSKTESNELSVRLELQADFLAGVWAHHAHDQRQILEQGDIEEGLNAANAIGDDAIQEAAQGYVEQEKFTHGSSAQRVRAFTLGMKTGDLSQMKAFFDAK